jgi:hypothetical protein
VRALLAKYNFQRTRAAEHDKVKAAPIGWVSSFSAVLPVLLLLLLLLLLWLLLLLPACGLAAGSPAVLLSSAVLSTALVPLKAVRASSVPIQSPPWPTKLHHLSYLILVNSKRISDPSSL